MSNEIDYAKMHALLGRPPTKRRHRMSWPPLERDCNASCLLEMRASAMGSVMSVAPKQLPLFIPNGSGDKGLSSRLETVGSAGRDELMHAVGVGGQPAPRNGLKPIELLLPTEKPGRKGVAGGRGRRGPERVFICEEKAMPVREYAAGLTMGRLLLYVLRLISRYTMNYFDTTGIQRRTYYTLSYYTYITCSYENAK